MGDSAFGREAILLLFGEETAYTRLRLHAAVYNLQETVKVMPSIYEFEQDHDFGKAGKGFYSRKLQSDIDSLIEDNFLLTCDISENGKTLRAYRLSPKGKDEMRSAQEFHSFLEKMRSEHPKD